MTVRYTARLSARARIFALGTSTFVLSGMLLIIPVVGGYADPPHAIKSNVQNIALGAPEAPAKNVAVVDASQNPAPKPTATDGLAGVQPPTVADIPKTAPKSEPSSPGISSPPASESSSSPAASASGSADGAAPSASSDSVSPSASSSTAVPSPPSSSASPSTVGAPPPGASGATTMVLSADSTQNFSMVGVTWKGATPLAGIAVQVRTMSPSGNWTAWTDMSVDYTQTGKPNEPVGTDPFWAGSSTGVEVTVTIQTGIKINGAKITLIDPNKQAQDSAGTSKPTAIAGAAVPFPSVYSRAQWGADESLATWDPQYSPSIKAVAIHHTADSNNYSEADVPGIMRSIYYYQAVTRGWGDIGYNAVVDKFGRAWEGRKGGLGSGVIGAHAGGFNQYTFGISMIGNYDLVAVPDATRETVAKLIAAVLSKYGVDPTGRTQLTQQGGAGTTAKYADGQTINIPTVFGHRDVGNTACPGQYGYAILPWLRARAAVLSVPINPQGGISAAIGPDGVISVNGWAVDMSQPYTAANIAVTDNGQTAIFTAASGPRPELASYGIPGNHGFSGAFQSQPGVNNVCLYIFNIDGGSDVTTNCVSLSLPVIDPTGAMAASLDAAGNIHVDGWALDMSSPASPVNVMIATNDQASLISLANGPRPELLTYYGVPGNHGFAATFKPTLSASYNVCLYVFNIGGGKNTNPTCTKLSAPKINPQGALAVSASGSNIAINGWAIDMSDPSSAINVMFTTNGQVTQIINASGPRPELLYYYGVPGNHGFVTSYAAPKKGVNEVCMFVFNIGGGDNQLVGCQNVTTS